VIATKNFDQFRENAGAAASLAMGPQDHAAFSLLSSHDQFTEVNPVMWGGQTGNRDARPHPIFYRLPHAATPDCWGAGGRQFR
jgi:hypothetical protein